MKKILLFLVAPVLLLSCYEEYVLDYDYDGIFFPNQINVRTVVVGEGLKIKIGTELGGVLSNSRDRTVNFTVQKELVTPDILEEMKGSSWFWVSEPAGNVDELKPLPDDYFTLSDPGKMIIEKGMHSGNVTVKVDSSKFLNDENTLNPVYALSLYITGADADTIPESLRYTVVGLRYENMLFGNYLHGGVTTVKNKEGNTVEEFRYVTKVNQSSQEIMELKTVSPNQLATNGFSKNKTGKNEILLTLQGNSILIGSSSGSSHSFEADGESVFNRSKLLQDRKIFLNYKYEDGDLIYHCQDTLTFRNRIRDGINEWLDENPDNYK